jgi:catalase
VRCASFYLELNADVLGSPKGVKKGDTSASGVQQTNFTLEGARSTLFDALFFPDGDESYIKTLETGRAIHFVREAYGHFKTIATIGAATSWLAHKCLPGNVRLLPF